MNECTETRLHTEIHGSEILTYWWSLWVGEMLVRKDKWTTKEQELYSKNVAVVKEYNFVYTSVFHKGATLLILLKGDTDPWDRLVHKQFWREHSYLMVSEGFYLNWIELFFFYVTIVISKVLILVCMVNIDDGLINQQEDNAKCIIVIWIFLLGFVCDILEEKFAATWEAHKPIFPHWWR